MSKKRKSAGRGMAASRHAGSQQCSLIPCGENPGREGIWREGAPAEESDQQKKESFEKARYWFRENGFVRMILQQRYAFYNFGFDVTEPDGSPLPEGWRKEHLPTLRNYSRDAWNEWLRTDNAIALWRANGGKVMIKKPETIDYTDALAEEVLRYRHGLSWQDIEDLPGLSKAEKDRLHREMELKLTHADSMFKFEVLKRELVGCGLASTGLRPIFLAAGRQESLEVSDGLLAFACRNIYEQHSVGHEIKGGTHAGSKVHFLKKPTADAIKAKLVGKTGFQRLITNFDHKILMGAGLPDPKQFAASRYEGIFDVMLMWAMPLGHLLLMKSMNPYLMEMLRVQAWAERDYLGPHLESIAEKALKHRVKVSWSNRCFQDMRMFVELLKFGLTSGPVSQKSYLQTMDLDQRAEQEAKKAEAACGDGATTPRYDGVHGQVKKEGRPAGEGDNRK